MPVDAAALARALHSSSASLDEKLDAARALCDVVFVQGHQDDPLPDLLRAHYAASLLDWLLSAIGRSGGGGAAGSGKQRQKNKSKAAEDNSAATVSAPRKELWKLLTAALQHPVVSPERALPASLLPAATTALHPDAGPADLETLSQLLRLLTTKFSGSFKPALDPTAALVAAALACRRRSPTAAAAALDLMLPLLQHHPNPRKAWDAVVPRLTGPLVDAAFGGGGGDDTAVADGCKSILSVSAFSQAHVAALAEAAAAGDDAHATKTYAAQLLKGLQAVVTAAAAGGDAAARQLDFLPWAVGQYCTAFAKHKRAAEIAAAIAKPTFGPGGRGGEQEKPAEARTIGGVPIDTDFRFFSAVAAIIERNLWADGTERAGAPTLLGCLASVCAALKSHHIYRPTEDPSGTHRERLAGVVACAVGLGAADPAVADAALRVLQAVLEVEHRGVQAHLLSLWPMLWSSGASGSAAQPAVAAALVQAYSELRQLEVLLSSLSDAIIALDDAAAAAAAAELLSGAAFRAALTTAVHSAPSGQAAPLVRTVAGWVPRLDTAPAPLVLADLGACVLGAVAADVTTAPAVAIAAAELVAALGASLVPELKKVLGRKKNGAPDLKIAGYLSLYRRALRLHARCCLLHPEVLSLAGQEVQLLTADDSAPSGGYFDALDSGDALDAAAVWRLGGADGACSPALQAALLAAAAQHLETLSYRRLHALHACGGAADESDEDEGSRAAVWRRRRDAAPAIESEMADIGAMLARRAGEGAHLGSCDALSLATAAGVPATARSLALSCASLAGVTDVLPHEALEHTVSIALDVVMETDSSSNETLSTAARAVLAAHAAAAALPMVASKRAHTLLRDLAAELPGSGDRKKKKVKTPEGKAKTTAGPLDPLIKCVKHASKGESDEEELSQAITAAAEGLEAGGSGGAAAAAPAKPGKRKRDKLDAAVDTIHEFTDLNRLLAALLHLNLGPLQPTGARALAATGLAAAAAALASGAGVAADIVSQALDIVAVAAPLPLQVCGCMPRFLAALGAAAAGPTPPEPFKQVAQQATQAVLRASSDDSGPGAAVGAWLGVALAAPLPASRLVVIEGVLAAARDVLAPVSVAFVDDDGGANGTTSVNPEALSLAAALVSTFETGSPALSSLLGIDILAPAAACAAQALAVRCWTPADAQGGLPEPSPLLQRLPEDVSAVAAALHTVIQSNGACTAATSLLRYLEAVSAVSCSMKPAAPLEHYASILCLLLHVLRLLPVTAAALDPVRRTVPLTAALPATRTAKEDEGRARAAALDALRALLAGSSSQRLRQVLVFAEAVLAGAGRAVMALHYRLPVTELALMALEGCKGKAAMRTLGQHAERLAAALTAAITNAACPLAAADAAEVSFNELYAAFCAVGEGEEAAPVPTAAWAAAPLPPPVESDAALAVATALRGLESIAARPKALPLSGRHVARELHAMAAAAAAPSVGGAASSAAAAAFVNACHLLMALARHREAELGRCMPLAVAALRALLTALVRWEMAAAASAAGTMREPAQGSANHRVYCAEALADAMAEIAAVKASEKYCPHILADYLILAACPATPASLAALGLNGGGVAGRGRPAALLCGPDVAAALRQGAYAVYGACGVSGVQYVYASLGARGGGGLWRGGLAALKADHDKSFKYTGKV